MNVLLHTTSDAPCTRRIVNTVRTMVAASEVHISDQIDGLVTALLQYRRERPMVIIEIGDEHRVTDIAALKDILDGLFLIVVATGNHNGLLDRCRHLYPRLIVRCEEDLQMVSIVIQRRLNMASSLSGGFTNARASQPIECPCIEKEPNP